MLTYAITTLMLKRDNKLLAICYSGNGPDLNNPASQYIKNHGPIPQGQYILEMRTNTHLGPLVYYLNPVDPLQMHGRSEFYIHWDNRSKNYTASDGCIVALTTGIFDPGVLKTGEILNVYP